jgi:hypothetical protein
MLTHVILPITELYFLNFLPSNAFFYEVILIISIFCRTKLLELCMQVRADFSIQAPYFSILKLLFSHLAQL